MIPTRVQFKDNDNLIDKLDEIGMLYFAIVSRRNRRYR